MPDQDLLAEIGRRVRERRRRLGLSQESLASSAQVRPGTLSRVENGKAEAGVGVLDRLARALGCRVGDLVDVRPPPGLDEGALLVRWRRVGPREQRAVLELLEMLAT